MIRLRHIPGLLFCLGLVTCCLAKPLYEWTFDESNGTELSKTINSGTAKAKWSDSFSDSYSDGNGKFTVHRTPGDVSNVFVEIEPITAESVPGRVWLIVQISGWTFSGESAKETVRIGFADKEHDRRPSVAAQVRLGRIGPNKVSVIGEGFGDGAKHSEEIAAFTASQTEPVTLVLEMDKQKDQFEIYYSLGDGPYIFLGEGKIDPERNANFLRLGLSGHFAAEGEHLKIDRIAVTETNPMRQ